jgi:hypothetical protein
MYLDCLNRNQIKVLKKLGFLKEYGFYLAGGTALALQLGHRRSMDLDFYISKDFEYKKLRKELENKFKEAIFIQGSEGTLIMKLDGVAVSFFLYPYPLIFPLIEYDDFPPIAELKDIAAMKLIAIADRGIKRDFYDIYFLVKEFSLDKIFEWVKKKYPKFNTYSAVRGLTYFEDAEKKKYQRRVYLFKYVSWQKVKKVLIEKTNEYRKKWLK